MSKLLRCDCPDCGTAVLVDEDGTCAHCGRDVCFVFENRREYMGETLRRVDWWRVLHEQDRWSRLDEEVSTMHLLGAREKGGANGNG